MNLSRALRKSQQCSSPCCLEYETSQLHEKIYIRIYIYWHTKDAKLCRKILNTRVSAYYLTTGKTLDKRNRVSLRFRILPTRHRNTCTVRIYRYVGSCAGQVHTYRRITSSIGIIYLSLPTYCASYGRHSSGRHPRVPREGISHETDSRFRRRRPISLYFANYRITDVLVIGAWITQMPDRPPLSYYSPATMPFVIRTNIRRHHHRHARRLRNFRFASRITPRFAVYVLALAISVRGGFVDIRPFSRGYHHQRARVCALSPRAAAARCSAARVSKVAARQLGTRSGKLAPAATVRPHRECSLCSTASHRALRTKRGLCRPQAAVTHSSRPTP